MSISCVLQARHADIQPAAVHNLDTMRDAERQQVDKGRESEYVCVSKGEKNRRGKNKKKKDKAPCSM